MAKHLRQDFVLLDAKVVPSYLTRSKAAARKNWPNLYQTKPYRKGKTQAPAFTGKEGLQLASVTRHRNPKNTLGKEEGQSTQSYAEQPLTQ